MKLLAFALALALSACAYLPSGASKAPQEVVAGGYVAYTAAGRGFVLYGRLPRCAATVPAPCSDQDVIDHAKVVSQKTLDELKAAEVIVRRPGVGTEIAASVAAAAEASVRALTTFSNSLPKAKE